MADSKLKLSLSPDENNELHKLLALFPTTPSLIERTLSYYLEFKTSTPNVPITLTI
jgi:hypothetical protein